MKNSSFKKIILLTALGIFGFGAVRAQTTRAERINMIASLAKDSADMRGNLLAMRGVIRENEDTNAYLAKLSKRLETMPLNSARAMFRNSYTIDESPNKNSKEHQKNFDTATLVTLLAFIATQMDENQAVIDMLEKQKELQEQYFQETCDKLYTQRLMLKFGDNKVKK
ncbi:MAG: hypothetical protein FWC61_03820 [Proteobacteria bacterium]|nr:hypothetical protein [Pseudomonadota bacterium]